MTDGNADALGELPADGEPVGCPVSTATKRRRTRTASCCPLPRERRQLPSNERFVEGSGKSNIRSLRSTVTPITSSCDERFAKNSWRRYRSALHTRNHRTYFAQIGPDTASGIPTDLGRGSCRRLKLPVRDSGQSEPGAYASEYASSLGFSKRDNSLAPKLNRHRERRGCPLNRWARNSALPINRCS